MPEADQIHAGGDVAPLIAASGLQVHAVVAVEIQVVHRLHQDVAELGVGDARFEARPDDLAGEHLVDREVLADVTQEVSM
jgi:hypothetical protein